MLHTHHTALPGAQTLLRDEAAAAVYAQVFGARQRPGVPPLALQPISLALSDETTALTVGVGKLTYRMPFGYRLIEVRAAVNVAPTGSTLIVDINKNGASILSTRLSIDATERTSVTAAVPFVLSDAVLIDDDELTFDIDQIGSTIAGAGLKVALIGYPA